MRTVNNVRILWLSVRSGKAQEQLDWDDGKLGVGTRNKTTEYK